MQPVVEVEPAATEAPGQPLESAEVALRVAGRVTTAHDGSVNLMSDEGGGFNYDLSSMYGGRRDRAAARSADWTLPAQFAKSAAAANTLTTTLMV